MADRKEVVIPAMGESISEATIANWLKKEGEIVHADEAIAELETDKVSLEVNAPVSGVLSQILKPKGSTVAVKEVVAYITEQALANSSSAQATAPVTGKSVAAIENTPTKREMPLPPAVKKISAEANIDVSKIEGSGKHGQVLKKDLLNAAIAPAGPSVPVAPASNGRKEEAVPMSRLRQAIAQRLVSAQQTAAILTTFNEVDMHHLMELRKRYQEKFLAKYQVKLGFMSLFVKATVAALKEFPAINAEIRGSDIVYKNYYDIGVAVGGPKGLVVPVVRNADQLNLAEIELEISRLAEKVKNGSIALQELENGTFTITNGGIYGSMMSTPIINPPQSGILGMHNIVQRPVVVDGAIVARPIMYLALSYDHRIVDGKEAVGFLVRIKEYIEDPARLLLGV